MPLIIGQNIYSFSGGTFVHAVEAGFYIYKHESYLGQVKIDAPVEWVKISPDGKSILLYSDKGSRIWLWSENAGLELFVEASKTNKIPGSGFITINNEVVTLLSKEGVVLGKRYNGEQLFSCNVRSPHSFYPRNFIQLPGKHIAFAGSFFGDHCDAVVTVNLDELFHNPDAVQHAIRDKTPVFDRAIDITAGPLYPNSAIVLRNPEDTELPEDEDDIENLRDVENFTGVYLRNLITGTLIGKYVYNGQAGSGAAIAGTNEWIALQVFGGIDMIHRESGKVHYVANAILDVSALQVCMVQNHLPEKVLSLDMLIPPG